MTLSDAMASTSDVLLHLSPKRHQCGVVAHNHKVGDVRYSLQLLVVPKMWKHMDTQIRLDAEKNQLQIIGREGQRLKLTSVPEPWRACIQAAMDSVLEITLKEHEKQSLQDVDDDDVENLEDKKSNAASRALLRPIVVGKPELVRDWSELISAAENALAQPLQQLVRLVVLAGALKERTLNYSSSPHGAGYTVDSGSLHSDPLRFINAHAFVQEVKAKARDVRQGYLLRTEWLSGVRGRITSRGLARYAATGEPRLECAYDDFTSAIPLFQVIVTALEFVARGGGFDPVLRDAASGIRDDARRLRQHLAHIPSLPVPLAAHKARQIRLTRLWRPWASALHMARLLLEDQPLDFTGQKTGRGALIWSVDTSELWENVLHQMLSHTPDIVVHEQQSLKPPWLGMAKKKPDLVFTRDARRWVLDAKYKDREKPPAPDRDEQYQLYVYSHLPPAQGEQPWPERGLASGLIYASPQHTAVQHSKVWPREPLWSVPTASGMNKPTVFLATFTVPFPGDSQLESDASWRSWIAEQGEALEKSLTAVESLGDAAVKKMRETADDTK